jgi:hypothetical protein
MIDQLALYFLDTRRIKHDTNTSSNGLRRKIADEAAADDAVGTVAPTDLSPRDTKLVSKLVGCGGFCDKGHLFAIIKLCVLRRIDTFDLDERHMVVLVAETSLESQNGPVNVKAGRPLCVFGHCCSNI